MINKEARENNWKEGEGKEEEINWEREGRVDRGSVGVHECTSYIMECDDIEVALYEHHFPVPVKDKKR